jgi:LPXTG-motif cell wall-anchored protein
MFRKIRLFGALVLLPWLLMVAVWPNFATATTLAADGPQTFTVLVGNNITTDNGPKPNWEGQNFYPAKITVNVGDTIIWKHNSGLEPHTVTFLGPETTLPPIVVPDTSAPAKPGAPPTLIMNPKVALPAGGATYDGSTFSSSGFVESDIPGPQDYKLTFTKTGSYPYLCLLHGNAAPDGTLVGMVGTVTVQAAGTAYPMTPDQVAAAGQQMLAGDVTKAKTAETGIMNQAAAMKPEAMPDGSMKYHVMVGGMDMVNSLEYQRFAPSELTIHVGDSVEWAMTMPGFHNVALGGEFEPFSVVAQQGGPPKIVANPQFVFPAGGSTYDGTTYVNSGPLAAPGSPPPAGPSSYALKFTKPGVYEFICQVHDNLGMTGHITVLAAGQTPGMPTTGSPAGDGWILLSAIAAIVLVLSGAAVLLRRRKAGDMA